MGRPKAKRIIKLTKPTESLEDGDSLVTRATECKGSDSRGGSTSPNPSIDDPNKFIRPSNASSISKADLYTEQESLLRLQDEQQTIQEHFEGTQDSDQDEFGDDNLEQHFRSIQDSWEVAKAKRNRELDVDPQSVTPLLGSYTDFKTNLAAIRSRLTSPLEMLASLGSNSSNREVTGLSLGFSTDPVPFNLSPSHMVACVDTSTSSGTKLSGSFDSMQGEGSHVLNPNVDPIPKPTEFPAKEVQGSSTEPLTNVVCPSNGHKIDLLNHENPDFTGKVLLTNPADLVSLPQAIDLGAFNGLDMKHGVPGHCPMSPLSQVKDTFNASQIMGPQQLQGGSFPQPLHSEILGNGRHVNSMDSAVGSPGLGVINVAPLTRHPACPVSAEDSQALPDVRQSALQPLTLPVSDRRPAQLRLVQSAIRSDISQLPCTKTVPLPGQMNPIWASQCVLEDTCPAKGSLPQSLASTVDNLPCMALPSREEPLKNTWPTPSCTAGSCLDDQGKVDPTKASHTKRFKDLFSSAQRQTPSSEAFVQQEVGTDAAPEFPLDFVSHGPRNENMVLQMPYALVEEGKKEWESTMVGYFIGRNLPYSLVTATTKRFWEDKGLIDTVATESGFFFFTFSTVEERDVAMEGGPWYIASQPLILKPWKPSLKLDKEAVHSIPIWVKFYGIPLEFWNPKGISYIASFIGRPLKVDRMTASRRRISYARVCIEVSGDQDLIPNFTIETDSGNGEALWTKINVEYQWTPPRCPKCSSFGHDCTRKNTPNQVPNFQKTGPPHTTGTTRQFKRPKKVEVGIWHEVNNKAKGKQVVSDPIPTSMVEAIQSNVVGGDPGPSEHVVNSISFSHPQSVNHSTHVPVSNSFTGLIPYVYGKDGDDRQDEDDDFGFPLYDESHEEVDFHEDIKEDAFEGAVDCPMSSRQKKKVAKRQFSGSRPKGRI